jgi:hypothetical protein
MSAEFDTNRMRAVVITPARIVAILVSALCLSVTARAQHSFSTNFDGTAFGGSITVGSFRLHTSSRPSVQAPVPRRSTSRPADASIQKFLVDVYQSQRQDVERRAEEESLRREREIAQRRNDVIAVQSILEQLQRLQNDEPNVVRRAEYTRQVLELQRQFEAARTTYLNELPSCQQRLASSLSHIVVPPPPHPLHYHRLLVRGTFYTPEMASRAAAGAAVDPFSGDTFDDVVAFGITGPPEVGRAILDHLLGQFQNLSADTKAQIGKLKGAEVDELVCHSNGCRVVQVLIATGMLKVHTLRMLGADNVAFELDALRTLKAAKGLREISVYMIHGDPIPLIDPGWRIVDLTTRIRQPLQSFAAYAENGTYQLLGLTARPGFNPDADIQVHTLSAPPIENGGMFAKHGYELYARVLGGWRAVGCLQPTGPVRQNCMIY